MDVDFSRIYTKQIKTLFILFFIDEKKGTKKEFFCIFTVHNEGQRTQNSPTYTSHTHVRKHTRSHEIKKRN